VRLSEIARSLGEATSLKKTIERLGRQLERWRVVPAAAGWGSLRAIRESTPRLRGVLLLQALGQVEQTLLGLLVGVEAQPGLAHPLPHPGPTALGQVLLDVAHLVDLAALNVPPTAEDRLQGFVQPLAAVDDQQSGLLDQGA
jgi:hypothetical protein